MVAGMDEGIGRVISKLRQEKLFDNTLVIFYSDNGGRKEHAMNFPYRGHKGMLFEGGIRVPFCLSWPNHVPGGKRYDQPMTALDIFPTALAAAGLARDEGLQLDGVNLIPYLSGKDTGRPHQRLFWRYAMGGDQYGYAIRDGDLKMVDSGYKNRKLLFDLKHDPWERNDLADQRPDEIERLTTMIQAWDRENQKPRWLDAHGPHVRDEEAVRTKTVQAASRGEKK